MPSSSSWRAVVDDPALLEVDDLVGERDRGHPVGDDEHGRAASWPRAARARIACSTLGSTADGGVVEDEQPRARGPPPGPGRSAGAARRRGWRRARRPGCRARRAAPRRSRRPARPQGRPDASSSCVGAEGDVAADGVVEHEGLLRHERGDRRRRRRGAPRAGRRRRASTAPRVGVDEPHEQVGQRRLAASRWARRARPSRPAGDVEGDVDDGRVAVGLAVLGLDLVGVGDVARPAAWLRRARRAARGRRRSCSPVASRTASTRGPSRRRRAAARRAPSRARGPGRRGSRTGRRPGRPRPRVSWPAATRAGADGEHGERAEGGDAPRWPGRSGRGCGRPRCWRRAARAVTHAEALGLVRPRGPSDLTIERRLEALVGDLGDVGAQLLGAGHPRRHARAGRRRWRGRAAGRRSARRAASTRVDEEHLDDADDEHDDDAERHRQRREDVPGRLDVGVGVGQQLPGRVPVVPATAAAGGTGG